MSMIEAVSLDPQSLVEQAQRQAGEHAGFSPFTANLAQLAAAIDAQARLSLSGRQRARSALVAALVTQAHAARIVARTPSVRDIEVKPIVITGLFRSGTTFLQHLLAQHPDLHSPQLWELMAPASDDDEATLMAAAREYVDEYYRAAPQFRAIHELGADLPEECHRLLGVTFASPIYALRYRIPAYATWLDEQDPRVAYAYHRLLLQCMLSRRPGGHVVLKCPTHLWQMGALAAEYPEATVVRLHRSPAVAVPSICSLTAVVRAARSDDVDREEIGAYWLERVSVAVQRLDEPIPLANPPMDIRYADLVADPLGIVERICDRVGVPLTAVARERMTAYLGRPGHAGRGNAYTAEEFGLSRAGLESRFANYIAAYDL
ncbi:sulfotransferase family protein [Sorangium sp. So ce1000]|uniref:sulfotransferase family protein n=1 Tax=Sorangium sp. So ce1000 TaxID=3133325 RepID=UPI003F5FD42D